MGNFEKSVLAFEFFLFFFWKGGRCTVGLVYLLSSSKAS